MNQLIGKPMLGQQIDWTHPLSYGLIDCWLMNEGGGNTTTDLASGFSCPIVTTPSWSQGDALYLGTSSYIQVGTHNRLNFSGTQSVTFVMRVMFTSSTTTAAMLLSKGDWATTGYYLSIKGSATRDLYFTTTQAYSASSSPLYELNEWTDLVVVKSVATIYFYKNSIITTNARNDTHSFNTGTNNFNIGRHYLGASNTIQAYYKHLYIYDRALAPTEILQLYLEPYCFIQPIRPTWLKQYTICPIYSRGNYAALPGTDASLETTYSTQDYIDVESDDGTRVAQSAIEEYTIHQFKECIRHSANSATIRWNGQSTMAPASSEVFLQIYNYNTDTWDTIDSDNITEANMDFDLEAIVADLTDYKDTNDIITCRVYQLAQ